MAIHRIMSANTGSHANDVTIHNVNMMQFHFLTFLANDSQNPDQIPTQSKTDA